MQNNISKNESGIVLSNAIKQYNKCNFITVNIEKIIVLKFRVFSEEKKTRSKWLLPCIHFWPCCALAGL